MKSIYDKRRELMATLPIGLARKLDDIAARAPSSFRETKQQDVQALAQYTMLEHADAIMALVKASNRVVAEVRAERGR